MSSKHPQQSAADFDPGLPMPERMLALLAALRSTAGGALLTWDQIERLNIGLNRREAEQCLHGDDIRPSQLAQYEFLFEHFPELADLPLDGDESFQGSSKGTETEPAKCEALAGGIAGEYCLSAARDGIFKEGAEPALAAAASPGAGAASDVSRRQSDLPNVRDQSSECLPLSWMRRFAIEPPRLAAFGFPDSNPVLRDVYTLFSLLAFEAAVHASQQLSELLGALAERFSASTAAVFKLEEGGRLNAFIRHNVRMPRLEAHIGDKKGIVAYVAREQRGYCAPDVSRGKDPLYRRDLPETQSEIAVPIINPAEPAGSKRLLGLVNLESREINAFSRAQIDELQAAVGAFVPHLLVLGSLARTDENWLPWHPDVHGWDLTRIFQKLCHTVAASLGADSTKCSIWYVDRPKQSLFVYATNGYDIEYKRERVLPLNSCTGKFAQAPRGAVYSADPLRDFLRREKAARMGLKDALFCPIYPPEGRSKDGGISVLNVYFTEESKDRPFVREAMVKLADVIGAMAASFDTQRQQIAAAQLHHLLKELPRSSESDFEVIRDFLKDVFAAEGVSIFARDPDRPTLHCAATTGLCHGDDRDSTVDPRHVRYELDAIDTRKGFTISVALNPGIALRMNNVLNRSEKDLPGFLRAAPLLKYVENFAPRDDKNRRMLAYGIGPESQAETKRGEPGASRGVIRVLRRSGSKPFTQCDERLIACLANVCRPAFDNWRRVAPPTVTRVPDPREAAFLARARAQSRDALRAFARILRPIPVGRSTRTLIGELVQDLFTCYGGWNIQWSGVFVRHGAPPSDCFRLHAYYSEPDSTPPLELADMPKNDPYLFHRRVLARSRGTKQGGTPFAVARRMSLAGNRVVSGIRIPMIAWSKLGLVEAVVALDFQGGSDWSEFLFDPLLYGVSRLAAIWSANNVVEDSSQETKGPDFSRLKLRESIDRFQGYVRDRFGMPVEIRWSPSLTSATWQPVGSDEDREASRYGLMRNVAEGRYAIPLRLGPIPTAYFLLPMAPFPRPTQLGPVLGAVTGIWSQLTFGRTDSLGQSEAWNIAFRIDQRDQESICVFNCDFRWNEAAVSPPP